VLRRESAALVDVRDAKTRERSEARAPFRSTPREHAEELFVPYEEWLGRNWNGKRMSAPGRLPIWCERHTHELKKRARRER